MEEKLQLTETWDKTFSLRDSVFHEKITFHNHYGITLAADLYKPKETEAKLPALAVCGPFGAVKEQASGLYAEEMASRGYLTIAFDPSFTGESGGIQRYMADPSINTEDFQAAIDYLLNREDVDAERVGIIGICGWGGLALNTACIDTRIKTTIVSTMYDMSRIGAKGYFDAADNEEARFESRQNFNKQRTEDYKTGNYPRGGGVVDPVPEDAPEFVKQYHAYYKTPRGYHERSLNSNEGWAITGTMSFLNTKLLAYSNEIRSAVLMIHGNKAHSYYFSKDAYENMIKDNKYTANKKFLSIEGATHTDLYDQKDKIPFDEIEKFLQENLK